MEKMRLFGKLTREEFTMQRAFALMQECPVGQVVVLPRQGTRGVSYVRWLKDSPSRLIRLGL
jgi:hypothetical protein